jgi:serine/threonine-protein kinase
MTLPKNNCQMRVGDVVAGRYCVLRFLGEGTTGLVFVARHLPSGRVVAIKLLHASLVSDRFAIERFRRETQVTTQFSCEYIARTFDVGHMDGVGPFMVMEYLDGSDIAKILKRNGALAIDRAVEFALQICVALAHAHGQGIIHRDIKPANLAVVRAPNAREHIKVLDFGISKTPVDESATSALQLTGNSVRLGSPLYASPEQRSNAAAVDERTDIWSLGVTLFEMLAGVVPFDSSPAALSTFDEPPSNPPNLSRYRVDAPSELAQVIATCLQRSPARRYANVGELAEALAQWAPPWSEVNLAEVWSALGKARAIESAPLLLPGNDTLIEPVPGIMSESAIRTPLPRAWRLWWLIAAGCGVGLLALYALLRPAGAPAAAEPSNSGVSFAPGTTPHPQPIPTGNELNARPSVTPSLSANLPLLAPEPSPSVRPRSMPLPRRQDTNLPAEALAVPSAEPTSTASPTAPSTGQKVDDVGY